MGPLLAPLGPALPARALASHASFPFNLPCAATLSALAPVPRHHNEEHAVAPSRKWGTHPRTAGLSNGGSGACEGSAASADGNRSRRDRIGHAASPSLRSQD